MPQLPSLEPLNFRPGDPYFQPVCKLISETVYPIDSGFYWGNFRGAEMQVTGVTDIGGELTAVAVTRLDHEFDTMPDAVAWLCFLATRERGKGMGSALLADAETWAASEGMTGMALQVPHERADPSNPIPFYERRGYQFLPAMSDSEGHYFLKHFATKELPVA